MPQFSGKKRGKPSKFAGGTPRNKKMKYDRETKFKLKGNKSSKHPFQTSKSIIKLDKSSKDNNKIKYVKPNGPLSKKDLRERRRQRKSLKSHGQLRCELNTLATNNTQSLPLSKRSKQEQHAFIDTLLTKMKGNILPIVKNLDATKTIQTCIKYGNQKQIKQITNELKGHFINLCCDYYAHRTIKSLLMYGKTDVRKIIISELMKAITRLILHRLASSVIDYAIMVMADEYTKRIAFQYFISPKFILMTQYEDNMDEKGKKIPKTINNILKTCDSVSKQHIIKNMQKFIMSGFEKDVLSSGIFQNILYYYICNIYNNKRKFEELIEFMIPAIMSLQNIKQGVLSILYIINYSCNLKPKLRKLIIKNISNFIITMSCDKYSYLIIIKILDIYDDTILINKHIIKTIIEYLNILMYHDFGRLILLHLLTPRNNKYFKKNKLYQIYCQKPITQNDYQSNMFIDSDSDEDNDNNNNNSNFDPLKQFNCKKNYDIKRVELLKKLLPKMIEYCCDNIKKILCHDLAGSVVIELVRVLMYDNDVKNINNLNNMSEKLINCIVNVSIVDNTARDISPEPVLPEPVKDINSKKIEINNIVDDSLKLVEEKQNDNTNLSSIDINKMDPNIVRNIQKLKQHQEMEKNNNIYMKLNAEYEIKMIEYKLIMIRHKMKIKMEDEQYGIMEHGLGHRRIRKMIEEFGYDFHKYFVDVLVNNCDQDKLMYLLSIKGVYVIWELYNCSNDEIKNKLKSVLKPVCKKMKNIIKQNNNNKYDGLKKLCNAVDIEL